MNIFPSPIAPSSPVRVNGLVSVARPVRPARRFNLDQARESPRPDEFHEHRRRRREQARSGEPQRSGSRAVRGRLIRRLARVRTCSSPALTRASHAAVRERLKQDACQRDKPASQRRIVDGSTYVGTLHAALPNQPRGIAQLPRRAFQVQHLIVSAITMFRANPTRTGRLLARVAALLRPPLQVLIEETHIGVRRGNAVLTLAKPVAFIIE